MGKRKLIGVFATEISSRVQGSLYKSLHERAAKLGYNLVLFSATHDTIKNTTTSKITAGLFRLAENMDLAAIIIHAQSLGDIEIINYLIGLGKSRNIPVLVYDCDVFGIEGSRGVVTIKPDYKQGFAESVRHLIEHHGCRHIFMLAGIKNNKYSDDRIEMYRQEMSAHGIEYSEEQIGYGEFWELPAVAAVNKFLDSGLPVDAICCAYDSMAISATRVLSQRGIRVPEDILVTGFDGIDDGKYNMPVISTCEPDMDAVSDFIFNVINGSTEETEYLIPLRFYPKESCGCSNQNTIQDRVEIARLLDNNRQNTWLHHMVAAMQFDMIDSCSLWDSLGYMDGTLSYFKDYSHLYCLRENIEELTDFSEAFDKMRVHFNKDFLTFDECGSFSVKDVIPAYERVFENAADEDIFMLRMICCGEKDYGYAILRAKSYSSNEVKLMGQFVESFTHILESILRNMRLKQANDKLSEMYERMSEIYIRDMLTGLYNRHGYYRDLEEYIKKAELQSGYLHLISIDMDGMKIINDNYGHLEGDDAIKAVAMAIEDYFEKPCISARFGGDEFSVAVFNENKESFSAEKISSDFNNYLKNMPFLAEKEYSVAVSVGYAMAKISEMENIKEIEKIADDCMYENKRRRKKAKQS